MLSINFWLLFLLFSLYCIIYDTKSESLNVCWKGRLKASSVRRRLNFSGEFLFISDHHSLVWEFFNSNRNFFIPRPSPHSFSSLLLLLLRLHIGESVSRLRKEKNWRIHSFFKNSIQLFPKGFHSQLIHCFA